MRVVSILSCFVLMLGISRVCGNIQHKNPEEGFLLGQILEFIQPYKGVIQDWFWELSGISYNKPTRQSRADFITCDLCVAALPLVKNLLKTNITDATIKSVLTLACVFADLAPSPEICGPTIESYAVSILYIMRNKAEMPNNDFCGILNPGCVEISEYLSNWKIYVDPNKPIMAPKPEPPPEDQQLIKILQFTDIHLDLDYVPTTNGNCKLPICCRNDTPTETNPEMDLKADAPAGYYGHVGCALPKQGLQALYDNAKQKHQDARLIFLTGDYVHSGIWLYSVEENTRHIDQVVQMLKNTFSENSYEIFPLTGNHEPDVVNMYHPEETWDEFPMEWLYKSVSRPFLDMFAPHPEELNRFLKYGYYSMTTKFDKNLKIVVLNSNICYINNFWLAYDAIDTNGQLQWFSHTLALAEKLQQKVFILSHIHPGSGSCWPVWSNQYNRIINRYEGIIRGQFFGHSHEQDYKITFERGTDRPISVSYVGGSAVTDGMNSGYNVYYADGGRGEASTWEIIDHETHILNLTTSVEGDPKFNQISSARADYDLKSLVPEEIHGFIRRMACNDTLFQTYQKVVVKGADSPRYRPCNDNDRNCRANVLGDLFVSNSADHSNRQRFENYIRTVNCTPGEATDASSRQYSSFILITLFAFGVYFQ